jgi:hypothetical protein
VPKTLCFGHITICLEKKKEEEILAGDLSGNLLDIDILYILQLITKNKKTGVLEIQGEELSGNIYFKSGEILHSECENVTGYSALVDLALITNGFFVFTRENVNSAKTIERSTAQLLMELDSIRNDWKEILKKIGSVNSIPVLTAGSTQNKVSLGSTEFKVIAKIDGTKSIREIAEAIGTSYFEIGKVVSDLIDKHLVEIKGEKKAELPVEPLELKVGLIRNLLKGEDGTWMSRILGMAPYSLIEEFENDHVVWIDVELVSKWEKALKKKIFSVIATTPRFEKVVLQISPQISLEDNLIFHEGLAKKLGLKEGDVVKIIPNVRVKEVTNE